MGWVILIIAFVIVFVGIREHMKAQEKIALISPEDRLEYLREMEHGKINAAMVCPHCQCVGKIRTKEVKQKKGVSGGKATAAVLTGGLSLLAVGLSRIEGATQAHCDNCSNTWFF